MLRKVTFNVITGSQNPYLNKFLQSADLAQGAFIDDGSNYIVEVTYKNPGNIKKIKESLRRAFERFGYYVLKIEVQK